MIEVHPFGDFVPEEARYLLLGSFTTKPMDNYVWFYSNGRNHFWPILEEVFGLELKTLESKQALCTDLRMALADIIYSCERINNSNLDNNLTNIVYNVEGIGNIVRNNEIEKIFFSSRFVEGKFRQLFRDFIDECPHVDLVYLPSPSPRYAAMSREEKVRRYKELLPERSLQNPSGG